MTVTFDDALDQSVTTYLQHDLPSDLTPPVSPRLGGVGTVSPHALRSPLLTARLHAQGVTEWTTVAHNDIGELVGDTSWDLAMVLSPFKLEAGRYCDELTPAAAETDVVDTLRRTPQGTILGCNTNAIAAATALSVLVGDETPRRVLVAGTGASTRSVLSGLRQRFPDAQTGVWGRSADKTAATAARFAGTEVVTDPSAWRTDVVVNATTVGETDGELPADFPLLAALRPGVRYFDLNNRFGPLQQAAVAAGCPTISGVMMQLVTNALRVAVLMGGSWPLPATSTDGRD